MLTTERLNLRWLTTDDVPFLFDLLNDPLWYRFIGNSEVETLKDASIYLQKRLLSLYQRLGFGLYAVDLKETGQPIGICGLIKRDSLDDVDIGFAFLPAFRGQGFGLESTIATIEYGWTHFHLSRIVAITHPENLKSKLLLEKAGLRYDKEIKNEDGQVESLLYLIERTSTKSEKTD